MCNLYHMSPRDDFEIYVRRHLGKLWLPEAAPAGIKPTVGPFDTGLFLRSDGEGGAVGEFGQWGLIRPGALARKDMIQPKAIPGKSRARPGPGARTTRDRRPSRRALPSVQRGAKGAAA